MDNNTKDKSELGKRVYENNDREGLLIREKILDEELKIIKEKIKNSNPKWDLKDSSEFYYFGYCEKLQKKTKYCKNFWRKRI